MRGRIRRRLALALVLTALTPVCAAILLSRSMLTQSSQRFFLPEIGQRLSQAFELYQDLAVAVKSRMRSDAEAIARSPALLEAAALRDNAALERALRTELARYSDLVSLSVQDDSEQPLADVERGAPVDPENELLLHVSHAISGGLELEAVFAAPRARFEHQKEEMGHFMETYEQLVQRRETDERAYLIAFAVLLGITIIAAVGVGSALARGVSTRLARLAGATEQVGRGDLRLRVAVSGSDEISDLARAFNHMLGEIETHRGRIEYLQQLATWQGMARRLAHEIKNPLTPIQLAVQEIHQRYSGTDPAYRQVVNTTLEIVEAEVGTLRRLVTEFSDFARLPAAKLSHDDLYEFLRAQAGQRWLTNDEQPLSVRFDVPVADSAPVRLDRQMFRRVLINLINNAARATSAISGERLIVVRADRKDEKSLYLHVDDNGPGIPEALRPTIFDPYVTHTAGGTGLGLAIVKKVVIEHEGAIDVGVSPLGGARITLTLPLASGSEIHRPVPSSSTDSSPPPVGETA